MANPHIPVQRLTRFGSHDYRTFVTLDSLHSPLDSDRSRRNNNGWNSLPSKSPTSADANTSGTPKDSYRSKSPVSSLGTNNEARKPGDAQENVPFENTVAGVLRSNPNINIRRCPMKRHLLPLSPLSPMVNTTEGEEGETVISPRTPEHRLDVKVSA